MNLAILPVPDLPYMQHCHPVRPHALYEEIMRKKEKTKRYRLEDRRKCQNQAKPESSLGLSRGMWDDGMQLTDLTTGTLLV